MQAWCAAVHSLRMQAPCASPGNFGKRAHCGSFQGSTRAHRVKPRQVMCRHNHANLSGIKAAAKIFPGKPQVRPG